MFNPNRVSKHYAAIIIGGKIISVGSSNLGGTSRFCCEAVTRHAEIDAISKVKDKKRLRKATLYSIRFSTDQNGNEVLSNAMPCSSCKNVAMQYGIKTIIYSDKDGKLIKSNTEEIDTKHTTGTIINMNRTNTKQMTYQRSPSPKRR